MQEMNEVLKPEESRNGSITKLISVIKNKITNLAEEAFLTVEFTGWYYGQVICNVLLVVLAFISYCGLAILYSQGQVRISSGRRQEDERKNYGNDNSSFAIVVAAYIACAIIVIALLIGQQYAF